jgi:hypothetical protein
MKTTLLALFIFATSSLLAQKTIYIRPTVSMKINNSRPILVGGGIKSPLDLVSNEYYAFYNYGWHLNTTILNLGLNAGIQLSKKSAIELSFSGDNASVKSAFVYNSRSYTSDLTSQSFFRYGAEYQQTLISNESVSTRVKIGLGIFTFNKPTTNFSHFNNSEPSYNMDIHETFRSYKRRAPVLSLGAGLDFNNKKGKPFCSVDFSFIYNRNRIMYSSDFNVAVSTQNQVVGIYKHSVLSTGTGFNLQLSFPIQVYTLGKKSNK